MATYSELMAQAQALMSQAEQARKNELAAAIADIKAKMKEYGITVADLGGAAAGVVAVLLIWALSRAIVSPIVGMTNAMGRVHADRAPR